MWRFLNVSNPKEDRDKRKREAREEYENEKRKRTYRKEWERDFKWLSYDDDNGVMVCRICRETNMTHLDEDFDVVEFDEVDELVDEVDSHSDTDSG